MNRGAGDIAPQDPDPSRRDWPEGGDGLHQLRLAVALYAGDTHDLSLSVECLHALDALLNSYGKLLDYGVGRDVESEPLADLLHVSPGRAAIQKADPPAGGLHSEHDVLGHREHRNQHEVLVDHPQACRNGVPRAWEFHGLLIDEDLALVGVIQPVQDVHESGLPGAILAEERVDLAGLHREIDVIIGDHAGEDLRDPPQLETHGDFLPQTEERECRRRHPLSLNPWRS